MKRTISMLIAAAVACLLVSAAIAQDAQQATANTNPTANQPDLAAFARLKAEMHRTLADLIEARTASQPDPAKIEELTKRLEQVREKLVTQRQTAYPGAGCPLAGCGWRACCGAGYGRGCGGCEGCGCRCCCGPAYGGPGRGPGMGCRGGMGRGYGPGAGMGVGAGPYFLDQDKNGICDRFENRLGSNPK